MLKEGCRKIPLLLMSHIAISEEEVRQAQAAINGNWTQGSMMMFKPLY